MSVNIFKEVVKKGLTFSTNKGNVLPQELFNIPLTSKNGYDLDNISKVVLAELRCTQEDSLVTTATLDTDNTLRLEILKVVISDKQKEIADKEESIAKDAHNRKIKDLIESKKEDDLKGKSLEELEALLK